jgi:hypothetical protein
MSSIRHVPRATRSLFGSLVIVVAVAAFAAATTGASAARSTPDHALLKTYQPVLVFHPDELFRPTKVNSFVKDSELEQSLGLDPALLPLDAYWKVVDNSPKRGRLPGLTPGTLFRLDQLGCNAGAPLGGRDCYAAAWEKSAGHDAVYGRVVRTPSAIVLQYWLFYYDDTLILPPIPIPPFGPVTFWQSHEGDWEVVNVILGLDGKPVEAAYSQHCSGQQKAWAGVQKSPLGSTHPVVYVALGSHANYFAPGAGQLGVIPLSPACIPPFVPAQLTPYIVDQVVDGSSVGAVVGPPDMGSGLEHASIKQIEGQSWASFGGRWGESEYFFTPIPLTVPGLGTVPANTAMPMGLAPASPANQATWQPATVLGWPS